MKAIASKICYELNHTKIAFILLKAVITLPTMFNCINRTMNESDAV